MTAPVLELERETIVRLQKENDAMESKYNEMSSKYEAELKEKDAIIKALTQKNSPYKNKKRKKLRKRCIY